MIIFLTKLEGSKGYFWKNDLCYYNDDGIDDTNFKIVVPKGRRKDLLVAGHNNPLAGHLGVHAKLHF